MRKMGSSCPSSRRRRPRRRISAARSSRRDAPQPVRLAILLFVGFYYENRDVPDHQTYATMREAFENLLYPYRDPEKMF